MIKISVKKRINVVADKAWRKISAFGGIEDYTPVVKSSIEGKGVGAKRICIMPSNAEIHEELSVMDSDRMHPEYVIKKSPMPVSNYTGIIDIKSVDEHSCEVSWGAEFEIGEVPETEIRPLFEGFFQAAIDGLEKYFN